MTQFRSRLTASWFRDSTIAAYTRFTERYRSSFSIPFDPHRTRVCVCVHVLVRFDRTRCLQGAVAWRCRAGRSGVAKIGRGEGEDGGRGLWIDIVTGVSSGFLGGATERVSRQTFGPMYQLNPARNAFAGTIGKRRVVSTRRYPIVVESRARVCLSRSTCEFVRVLNNNNNN